MRPRWSAPLLKGSQRALLCLSQMFCKYKLAGQGDTPENSWTISHLSPHLGKESGAPGEGSARNEESGPAQTTQKGEEGQTGGLFTHRSQVLLLHLSFSLARELHAFHDLSDFC